MKRFYSLIADRVARDPAVLGQALATLDRWEADGIVPTPRAVQWRRILRRAQAGPDGMAEMMTLLTDEGEEAARLMDFAPFAGILSREERRKAFLTCAYDH